MSAINRSVVELRFSDGEVFNSWLSFSLRDTFTDPLGDLSFTAAPPRARIAEYRERLRKGELAVVLVNGAPQANALIQSVEIKVSKADSVTFDVHCQTVLATPYEASAHPDYAFHSAGDVPVSSVVLDLLGPFGFDEIHVDAALDVNARTGKPLGKPGTKVNLEALKHSDCQVQEGEAAYAAAARVVTRLGAIIRVNTNGQLLICKPRYDQDAAYAVVQDFGRTHTGDRFLDDVSVLDTNEGQFSEVVCRGVAADRKRKTSTSRPASRVAVPGATRPASAPYGKVPLTELSPGPHRYRSAPDVAAFKPRYVADKFSRDIARCKNTAQLVHGMRCKDAFVVSGSVDGFISRTGRVWSIDTMARVVVEAAGLDEDMYLVERVIKQDKSGGQTTRLRFIPRDSLTFGDPSTS